MTEEQKPSRARAAVKTTLVVAFAVVPAGSVLIGVPYLVYRWRKRRRTQD